MQNLTVLAEPLPELVPPNNPAASGLSEDGLHGFQSYLPLGRTKLSLSLSTASGWQWRR
jgi:hypothetical protein